MGLMVCCPSIQGFTKRALNMSVSTIEEVIQIINSKQITPDFCDESIFSSIQLAQTKNTKECRISSYRILELLANKNTVDLILRKYHFDVFIIKFN